MTLTALYSQTGHMPSILTFKIDKIFFSELVRGTFEFQALSKAQSDWRRAAPQKYNDLFAAILGAKDPETGKGFTTEELVAEAGLFIVAGSDTTATSLTATLFYCLNNPICLARLTEEIDEKFHLLADVRIGSILTSCTYLFACIDEAMRMSPSIPGLLPREVLPGGMSVDGHWIREGTDVGVPHYAIHHKENYYRKPFDFNPERWIKGSLWRDGHVTTEAELQSANAAFCPFSLGRTGCLGKYLAYQEMGILLARMVFLFDMRLRPGSCVGGGTSRLGHNRYREGEFQLYDKFVSTHNGPLAQFRRRTPKAA